MKYSNLKVYKNNKGKIIIEQDCSDSESVSRNRIELTPHKAEIALSLLELVLAPKALALSMPDRFDDFWKVYPKKADGKKARIIWKRRKLDEKADILIKDVKNRLANDRKWIDGYIPNPTTYLNGDRWEDELQQPAGQPVLNSWMNEKITELDAIEGESIEVDDNEPER